MTFVYFDAGGGHRSATQALASVIAVEGRPWEISCLNLQKLLDGIDLARQLTGYRIQDVYNAMLARRWTIGAEQLLPVFHAAVRLFHRRIVRLLEDFWRASQPEMVVSLIPNFNRALAESVRRALPSAPFVTILTDLADYPPHLWIEAESEYLICGTERAVEQALAMGHPPERVFRVSGMILNPAFYEPGDEGGTKNRRALGLDAERPTGLVMFGGQGARVMLDIARRLSAFENLQLIFLCGHNEELAERLRQTRFRFPTHVEGFTERVQDYMRISDFFIGKPGPGSVSEALQTGLPVVVERNAWTLPQERYNADWIRENNLGIVVPSFRQIGAAVERMLDPAELARYRANAAALKNRAVFEIPEILARIPQDKRPTVAGQGEQVH
jgi:1,2-diacylglycerol 3-beta-galactosyltransferase